VLREWKLRCSSSELDLVFPSEAGSPMFYQNLINWVLEPLLHAAELTRAATGKDGTSRKTAEGATLLEGKYSMHDFRHAAASLWIEQRVDPKRIQRWMGHSSIQVTFDTYGHLFERAEEEAAIMRAMEAELLGQSPAAHATGVS
jgi:integrase